MFYDAAIIATSLLAGALTWATVIKLAAWLLDDETLL